MRTIKLMGTDWRQLNSGTILAFYDAEPGLFGSERGVDLGCDQHIASALQMSADLLKLANEPREDCEHDGCLLLDGVARDCAWKIRQVALQWRADLAALDGGDDQNSDGTEEQPE